MASNSLPTLLQWVRCPSLASRLIRGARRNPCFSETRGIHFSAGLWNFSDKPITSFHGKQEHLTLLRFHLPRPPFYSVSKFDVLWPWVAYGVFFPWAMRIWVIICCRPHLFSDVWCVSGHLYNPGVEIPPLTMRWTEGH